MSSETMSSELMSSETMSSDKIDAFLTTAGWGAAILEPLAGDASNRRYLRLTQNGKPAVLMDAPPARGEDIRPFVRLARHLSSLGLSAPGILAEDPIQGLLLLEDLGDDLFARLCAADPTVEPMLYHTAAESLFALHQHPAPADLMPYDSTTMPDLGALALDWYVHDGNRAAAPTDRAGLCTALTDALAPFDKAPRVLVQRDFHAENLLWLPEREGVARVGLLDFQDAAAGHAAYDLVSLLEDARRDVSPATVRSTLARYLTLSGDDPETFAAAYAVMGAQRNLRIIGVFARLSLHFGKPHYIDLIPRVWTHLQTDLAHPALTEVKAAVIACLPTPTDTHLKDLKDKCGTIPTL